MWNHIRHCIGQQSPVATIGRGLLTQRQVTCSRSSQCFLWRRLQARQYSEAVQASHPEADDLFRAIELEVKSADKAVLESYQQYVCWAAKELDIQVAKVWSPPRVIEKHSLLKSVHVYKKHFVQYERRTNYKTIQLKHLTGSTANTFLEYIERNLPEGVAMKVTKHKVEPLPDYIRPPVEETTARTPEIEQTNAQT